MPNLWLIFLTGLLTGGVSCMAVQGGLLVAMVAGRLKQEGGSTGLGVRDISMFLIAKFVAHVLLGGILGMVGLVATPNPSMMMWLQGLVGVYMLLVAGAMLDLHPIFRPFLIQTPKFLRRYVRETSKNDSWFAPAMLGAATVFIPCGTTQAMMVSAVGTGSPVWGAAVLGTFVLGTSPMFFALGYVMTRLGEAAKNRFLKLAAVGVAILALISINSALILSGSNITFQKVATSIECAISFCATDNVSGEGRQTPTDVVNIIFDDSGYQVDNKVVKAGSQVKLNLINNDGYGCVQAFVIPSLGVSKVVPVGSRTTLDITVPEGEDTLAFSCSMGMYTGELAVVK